MTASSKLKSIRSHYQNYGAIPPWMAYGLDRVRGRALLKSERPNVEGLTFYEWLAAANPELAERIPYAALMSTLRSRTYSRYTKAWLAGEDPTDWRAAFG